MRVEEEEAAEAMSWGRRCE